FFSTRIVAVTQVVADVLVNLEGVDRSKVVVIHHGFHLENFYKRNISSERIDALKVKYNPSSRQPVIGVISRFVEWKGIQYIIPAFQELLQTYPNALLLLANAQGNYSGALNSMLAELPAESYQLISFENDIFALYRLMDVFVHVPVTRDAEAFGQIYIEALAASVCMICTESGVSAEVVSDNFNALVVPHMNSSAILQQLLKLLGNTELQQQLKRNAPASVSDLFSVETMISRLEDLYG
ncbi:MAG: glycosyltransferase family 4 protein, partial [Bacteroidota bacterium]